ncbi:MAG: fibronectin type III domain-containing protein [Pseudomonadota bacterium]|nr:fibronectin type III domain-containing protein [Pseudomonadota bacterium]
MMNRAIFCTPLCLFLVLDAQADDVTLSWEPSADRDVDGYRVYYGNAPGDYDASVDAGSFTSLTIRDLQPGFRYYFSVRAYDLDARREGDFSKEISVLLDPEAGEATLAWGASPDAAVDGYNLHYGLAPGAYDRTVDVGANTSSTISGLVGGQTYFFVVTAYDRDTNRESAFSNEISRTAVSN